jgi:hypothetical protein
MFAANAAESMKESFAEDWLMRVKNSAAAR